MTWRDRLEARLDIDVPPHIKRWAVPGAVVVVAFITVIMGLDPQ